MRPETGYERYELVRLANGVHSVHSREHGETFHPVIGPEAEAEALYVRQLRLRERIQEQRSEFVVWDVGLGAGANPLTVLRATRDLPCHLRILSFDRTLEPLKFAIRHAEALGYPSGFEKRLEALVQHHRTEFRDGSQRVVWEYHGGDFPRLIAELAKTKGHGRLPPPHAILFDAYSPATNPSMWTLKLFTDLHRLLDAAKPCAMPTYSRSTMLRVTLLLAGFFVGVGHATGEKEETTIAANTLHLITEPLNRNWLGRARRSTSSEPLREPVYRQSRLSPETWEALQQHPQFSHSDTEPTD